MRKELLELGGCIPHHTATLFNLQGCIHHISAGFQHSVSLIFPQACDALEGAVLGLKAGEVKMAGTGQNTFVDVKE